MAYMYLMHRPSCVLWKSTNLVRCEIDGKISHVNNLLHVRFPSKCFYHLRCAFDNKGENMANGVHHKTADKNGSVQTKSVKVSHSTVMHITLLSWLLSVSSDDYFLCFTSAIVRLSIMLYGKLNIIHQQYIIKLSNNLYKTLIFRLTCRCIMCFIVCIIWHSVKTRYLDYFWDKTKNYFRVNVGKI